MVVDDYDLWKKKRKPDCLICILKKYMGFKKYIFNQAHWIHMSTWLSANKKALAMWQAKGQRSQQGCEQQLQRQPEHLLRGTGVPGSILRDPTFRSSLLCEFHDVFGRRDKKKKSVISQWFSAWNVWLRVHITQHFAFLILGKKRKKDRKKKDNLQTSRVGPEPAGHTAGQPTFQPCHLYVNFTLSLILRQASLERLPSGSLPANFGRL